MSEIILSASDIQKREIENAELRWLFLKRFIEPKIKEASNDQTAMTLLPNHEYLIRNVAPLLCIVKCRKTAHSWGIAAKALARAATEPRSTTIIGSYDEDEAKEKNNFLDWQYGCLPPALRRELGMTDAAEIRRFNNGSRIKLISRKPPTGAGASIEWDEFSVEKQGRVSAGEILHAALGCITHTGSVSIGGTQRGADTVFNQIVTGKKSIRTNDINQGLQQGRSNWLVGQFPWWSSPALCNDVVGAAFKAPGMPTASRVELFGNEKLQNQYDFYCTTPDAGEDVFQREFELRVLDDRESYYPIDLIRRCYPKESDYWFEHVHVEGIRYSRNGDCFSEAKGIIDRLATEIKNRRLTGEWGWAQDIGYDHDLDEIWIGHVPHYDRELLLPRVNITMEKMPFDGKQEIVEYMFKTLPITRGAVDATKGSMGVQFGQWANKRWAQRALPVHFDANYITILASGMKARMQTDKIVLPAPTKKYQKLENQLLRVKKIETAGGRILFDVQRNKKEHGDCFYALGMLSELFSQPVRWRPQRGAVGSYNVSRSVAR